MNWREQKDLLVRRSEANRRQLMDDWQRLRSPKTWTYEAGNLVKRHPVLTAALATTVGALTVRAIRQPAGLSKGVKRLKGLTSAAVTVWKLFRGRKSARD